MRNAGSELEFGEDEVADATRHRFVEALGTLIEERGYAATAVVDIVRVAQASKRTFYLHFSNKHECYLALLSAVTDKLVRDLRASVDPNADWDNQVRQAVSTYIAHLSARPAISLSWIRDLPALGAIARPTQRRNYAELAAFVAELSANPGFLRAQLPPISRPQAVMLLAGLRELAAQTVEDGTDIHTITAPASDIAVRILQADTGRGEIPEVASGNFGSDDEGCAALSSATDACD